MVHRVVVQTEAEYNDGVRKMFFFIISIIIPFSLISLGFHFGISEIFWLGIFWAGIVLLLVYFRYIRKWLKKKKFKREKRNHNIFSLKTLIIYGVTFTIGFWVFTLIIPFIKITNLVLVYLLMGLCLELSAKVCQMFLYKNLKITLDKWFVLWVLIHSLVIYGVLYLVNKIAIQNHYLFLLVVGFAVAIITHFIWRVMYKKK